MKSRIFLYLTIASCAISVSCSKMLDMKSDDGRMDHEYVFSNFYRTQDYFTNITNAIQNVGMTYDNTPLASFCDEAFDSSNGSGGRVTKWYNGNVSSFSNPLEYINFWGHYYNAIRRCNTFLYYLELPELESVQNEWDERIKAGWLAQVRVIRAYCYLQLIKRYGPVPLVNTLYDVNHDYSNERRASFEECVDFILDDCRTALETPVPAEPNIGFHWFRNLNARGHMSRGIACAIMSQAALYAASPLWYEEGSKYTWENVAAITKESLDLCLDNGYQLYKNDGISQSAAFNCYDYFFITRTAVNGNFWEYETLLDTRDNMMTVWSSCGLPTTNGSAKAGACPTQELVDAYEVFDGTNAYPLLDLENPYLDEQHLSPNYNPAALAIYDENDPYENRDPRFYGSVYFNGSIRNLANRNQFVYTYVDANEGITSDILQTRFTKTGYYMRKFNNWQSNVDAPNDGYQRLFRLAELYLNFAEAANEAHGPDYQVPGSFAGASSVSAKDAVDAVRERVGMPALPSGMTKKQFTLRYRNERRIELAFEEHRYFDVRRWMILDETDAYLTGMRITQGYGNYNYTRFSLNNTPNPYSEPKFLLFPIGQDEINKMLHHTGNNWQNPGWQ